MVIEELRDLIIVISGATAAVVLIIITVLFFILYRRINKVLIAAETITKKAREISAYVSEEVVKPAVQVAALIQGARAVANFLRRKQGGKDGGNR